MSEKLPRGLAVPIHLTDYFTLVDADLIHEIIGIGVNVVGTVVVVEVVVVVVVVVKIVDSVNGLAEKCKPKREFWTKLSLRRSARTNCWTPRWTAR